MKNLFYIGALSALLLLTACGGDASKDEQSTIEKIGEESNSDAPITKGEVGNITFGKPEVMELPPEIKNELSDIKDAPEGSKHYLFRLPYEVTGNSTNTGDDSHLYKLENQDGVIFEPILMSVDQKEVIGKYFNEEYYVVPDNITPGTKAHHYLIFTINDKFIEKDNEWSLIFGRLMDRVTAKMPLGNIF